MEGQGGRWEDGWDERERWGRMAVLGVRIVGSRLSAVCLSCCGLEKIVKQGGEWGHNQIHFSVSFLQVINAVNTGEEILRKRRPRKHHIGYTFWLPREVECQSGQS